MTENIRIIGTEQLYQYIILDISSQKQEYKTKVIYRKLVSRTG